MTTNDDVLRVVARVISEHVERHAEQVRASIRTPLVLRGNLPDPGSRARELVPARDVSRPVS